MPILCIHNPVIHKDPQTYYQVEVGFTKLHTCPQEALDQLLAAVPVSPESNRLFNLAGGWVHYRPSRVGPVLRLPAANGNRKVTVLVWLESPSQATETVTQGQQISISRSWPLLRRCSKRRTSRWRVATRLQSRFTTRRVNYSRRSNNGTLHTVHRAGQ